MLTLGGVVEVLVDKLSLKSAHEIAKQNRINGNTNVVGGLAQVTESRDRKGEGAVDILGELLGGAVRLGNVRRERGRHDWFVVVSGGMGLWYRELITVAGESRGEEQPAKHSPAQAGEA
jgi:hypothetical protein